MDWETYKECLRYNLNNWFNEVIQIQNRVFETADILFDLNTNTLDVFGAITDIYSSQDKSIESWLENEQVRQRQKSLGMKIGDLHELMIFSLKDSIHRRIADENGVRIYDLYDDTNKWIAEIKNKHNTTKGDDQSASFKKLREGLNTKSDEYKAYYVTILRGTHPKVNKSFYPSDNTNGQKLSHDRIIHMDGESFYEMVTGDVEAFQRAFRVFNEVLAEKFDVSNEVRDSEIINEISDFSFFKVKININTASEKQLEYLPSIGNATAKRIIVFREQQSFTSPDQLKNVPGIGKITFEKLEPFITI